jgi:hypothetical protein
LESLRWWLVVRIILVLSTIMIIIHLLRTSLRMTLGLLAVDEISTLSLGKTVDFRTGDTGEKFFGEAVADFFT